MRTFIETETYFQNECQTIKFHQTEKKNEKYNKINVDDESKTCPVTICGLEIVRKSYFGNCFSKIA